MLKLTKLQNIKTKEVFDSYFQDEIWLEGAKQICFRHQVKHSFLKRLPSSDHIVFAVDDLFVLKIYRPFRDCFQREIKAINFISNKIDFAIPELVEIGEFEGFEYVLMTKLSGDSMTRIEWLKMPETEQTNFVVKLARGLNQIHELNSQMFENNWSSFITNRAETLIERQIAHGVNHSIIKALPKYLEDNFKLVPTDSNISFLHGDVHFGNLSLNKSVGNLAISGLFDFADSRKGFYEYDFLAIGVLMIQGQREIQREFFKAYGYSEKDLDESMRKRLMMLTMLYETADLRRYAMRLRPEAVDFTLEELERGIWSFV